VPDVVALLRSVNVGGNRMKMDWLRDLATELGCRDVRTVVATGNVVMSPPEDMEATGTALQTALAERFGTVAVVMRTHEELHAAVRQNPWADDVDHGILEGRAVHTMFCDGSPATEAVRSLPRDDSQDDLAVAGQHAYLKLAGSMVDTRYTGAWFERHLGVVGTMRNHNTVLKLLDASA